MSAETAMSADILTSPQGSRVSSWAKRNKWFVIFVIIPTLLTAIYYGFFAADIYVSESRFVIKSPDDKKPQMSSLANLIQTTGLSAGQEQANEVLDYVRSRDALAALDRHMAVRQRFANGGDIFTRFPSFITGNSFEYLYRYYSKMVDASLDPQTGTAVVKVKAFTPEDAYQINRSLLGLSEDLVNRLNARARDRGIAEAERQVQIATERTRKITAALTGYRNQVALIDPAKQAGGVIEIANQMVAQRSALQAQLETMERETPRNPAIPALRNRIAAISSQIAQQNGRVVGGANTIASKLGNYDDLLVEQKFANENLTAANAGLVQARSEAQKQQFYLERVVEPNRPDTALLPHRLLGILTVAASLLCLYFIGWMLVIGILEHAPEN
ncbi:MULTISPECIES: capsule biosynthesis protein [Novosphingobium]|uniref:capsule biosynthesis protein n=1 Tax=Novosphingobium TaxID=165696 RepID=UPI0007878C86|nr:MULTISPECIES: capsule biosynthesis protein [Novosphingobium]WQD94146.1 capsule biosynthesis protein [Novosphingobium capsulatum]